MFFLNQRNRVNDCRLELSSSKYCLFIDSCEHSNERSSSVSRDSLATCATVSFSRRTVLGEVIYELKLVKDSKDILLLSATTVFKKIKIIIL
jgi:hypothetical protein